MLHQQNSQQTRAAAKPQQATHLQPWPTVALNEQTINTQVLHIVEPHVGITCSARHNSSAAASVPCLELCAGHQLLQVAVHPCAAAVIMPCETLFN
jgi:hypothetical protein